MKWTRMNQIQKLMVRDDFFNESFPADDCLDQIDEFVEKRQEDTDDEYIRELRRPSEDTVKFWRNRLTTALRQLENMPVSKDDDEYDEEDDE